MTDFFCCYYYFHSLWWPSLDCSWWISEVTLGNFVGFCSTNESDLSTTEVTRCALYFEGLHVAHMNVSLPSSFKMTFNSRHYVCSVVEFAFFPSPLLPEHAWKYTGYRIEDLFSLSCPCCDLFNRNVVFMVVLKCHLLVLMNFTLHSPC